METKYESAEAWLGAAAELRAMGVSLWVQDDALNKRFTFIEDDPQRGDPAHTRVHVLPLLAAVAHPPADRGQREAMRSSEGRKALIKGWTVHRTASDWLQALSEAKKQGSVALEEDVKEMMFGFRVGDEHHVILKAHMDNQRPDLSAFEVRKALVEED